MSTRRASTEVHEFDGKFIGVRCQFKVTSVIGHVLSHLGTGFHARESEARVYRARFSSVTKKDISKAMENLVPPNRNEALVVDARQEIDLKVVVAFTRFQTGFLQGKYRNLDSRVIILMEDNSCAIRDEQIWVYQELSGATIMFST